MEELDSPPRPPPFEEHLSWKQKLKGRTNIHRWKVIVIAIFAYILGMMVVIMMNNLRI